MNGGWVDKMCSLSYFSPSWLFFVCVSETCRFGGGGGIYQLPFVMRHRGREIGGDAVTTLRVGFGLESPARDSQSATGATADSYCKARFLLGSLTVT